MGLKFSKTASKWYTFSNKATPPKPAHTVMDISHSNHKWVLVEERVDKYRFRVAKILKFLRKKIEVRKKKNVSTIASIPSSLIHASA